MFRRAYSTCKSWMNALKISGVSISVYNSIALFGNEGLHTDNELFKCWVHHYRDTFTFLFLWCFPFRLQLWRKEGHQWANFSTWTQTLPPLRLPSEFDSVRECCLILMTRSRWWCLLQENTNSMEGWDAPEEQEGTMHQAKQNGSVTERGLNIDIE